MTEYSWIVLSETFLAMTIFKNDIDSVFVFAFAFLMTFKIFHWILRDRIDYVSKEKSFDKNRILEFFTFLDGTSCSNAQ